ncbi:MAG TPA: radical SAM family heme chaperone HemW [Chitinophagaceae bacterium]|nr:radical SAM family heme chaperone HemW [Chitinophagaceae bacterium]
MAGIYLHIPFCKQACYYCNFHFSTLVKNRSEMVNALLAEIDLQQDFFHAIPVAEKEVPVHTIYFGGGTPSLLEANDIQRLIQKIRGHFNVSGDPEITLEANPDDISMEKLSAWRGAGVNRLSIGVQSFFEEDLKWMNRGHNARQALRCMEDARKAGFDNFSADLIYGIPRQSDERWRENINKMIALEVPHLSCYALTVEARTPLDNFIRRGKYPPVDEAQAARQYEMLMELLAEAGYEHYEISNFAKPGRRSVHNSNYWHGASYLGVGPSAHSYRGETRQWNVTNNAVYVKSILEGRIPFEKETLTPVMQLNEYIMTSFRTREGCDLDYLQSKWGPEEKRKMETESRKFRERKWMTLKSGHLVLTSRGKLFADGIAAELFRERPAMPKK